MHGIRQESSQDDSSVKKMELPAREESNAQSFQEPLTLTKKQGMSRNRQYLLAGGVVLLIVVVILASALSSLNRTSKQPAQSAPQRIPTAITGSASSRTIPVPTAKPINSPVSSDYNVSVTAVNGVIYAGTANNAAYALNAGNGSVLWQTKIDGAVEELPVVANGVVYISSLVGQDGPAYLSALRASDGAVLWRYKGDSYIPAPLISNGVVYIVAEDDGITALQASDGTRLWHFTAQQGFAYEESSIINGTLYVSAGSSGEPGDVYALRASDGSALWRYTTSDFADMLTIQNGVVYLFSQSKLSALRANDGHQIWSRPFDTTFDQTPQLVNGVIYLMTTKISYQTSTAPGAGILSGVMSIGTLFWGNGQDANARQTLPLKATNPLKEGKSTIYAIRASDGTMLWQYAIDNGANSIGSWLQVEHGVIYASAIIQDSSDNTSYVSALQSSDGKVLWQDKMTGSSTGVLLVNGIIYTGMEGSSAGAVYTLRELDGSLLWSYPISGTLFFDPILANTTVYMGAGNGMVYALRANNGSLVWHYLTNVGS